MKTSHVVIALSLLCLCFVPASFAATTWRMAAAYAPSSSHTEIDEWFAKQVTQATDGDLNIRVYANGSLVKHPDIMKAVSIGQVQMGDLLASILSNENAIFALDSIPFLATSQEQAKALWQAQRPQVEQYLESKGVMLLYASPWPAQGLYTNKEINSVSDLEGLKMRTYNKMGQKTAELLKATPTQVEVPQLPQAFSTGMVNAMFASPATGRNTQAWDYAKYFYNVKAWIPKNLVIMNKSAFDALPEDQQHAIVDAADQARQRSWSVVLDILKRDIAELKQHGMHIIQPSDDIMQEFREVGKKLTQEWEQGAGDAGMKAIEAYRTIQNDPS